MSDAKNLEEAKRIMARMVNTPPKPHKAESPKNTAKANDKKRSPQGK